MRLNQPYAQLPDIFFASVSPTPVSDPKFIALNLRLADALGIDKHWLASEEGLAVLSGQTTLSAPTPIAMAYAGHQFGHWVPILGDGRAMLLGEHQDPLGHRWDIQLKGAGPTPFSRNGDGLSSIGPVVREYLASEAMAALGIPTTRSLVAISTGDRVQRQRPEPGGLLVRVAKSHIRIGTFEYFARQGQHQAVLQLLDFVIGREHPDLIDQEQRALLWFTRIIEMSAHLISQWMQVGFIHGVMNTDNMSVSGETLDYGPFGFLDSFVPETVYSSIDTAGRYAYNQQPAIGAWNLARLAECLLPLIDADTERAIEIVSDALKAFPKQFKHHFEAGMTRKVGLDPGTEKHRDIAMDLLDVMAANDADMTLTYRHLSALGKTTSEHDQNVRVLFDDPGAFDQWAMHWRSALAEGHQSEAARRHQMKNMNPAFILRNHLAQRAVDAAIERLDFEPMHRLLKIVTHPYDDQPDQAEWAGPPAPHERVVTTFCGT